MVNLLFGLTVNVYGVALLVGPYISEVDGRTRHCRRPAYMIAGVLIAYTGFSGLTMAINMPASFLLLAWMLTVGVFMWRRGGVRLDETAI